MVNNFSDVQTKMAATLAAILDMNIGKGAPGMKL